MILTLIPALLGRGTPQGTAPGTTQGTRSPADTSAGVPGPSSTDGAGAASGPGFAALFLALLGGGTAAQAAPEGTGSASLADGSDQGEGAGAGGAGGGSADAPSASAFGTSARVGRTAPAGWAFLGETATVGPEDPDGGMDPRLALTLRTTTPSTGTPSTRIASTETPAAGAVEAEGTPRPDDGPAAGARADAPRPVRSDPGDTVSPVTGSPVPGSQATGTRGADAPDTVGEVEVPGAVRGSAAPADTDDDPRLRESAGPEGATGAAAAVAAGTGAYAPSDVRKADRALSKLDPELRAKVERVIERMADEHGTRVELVEGYRSSERQRFLYAQGRTRPGPVVTWTKTSLHMDGKAADLKVEGPWSQREAYVLLQKVAAEEGLGTLGMKDPGHVELADTTVRTAAAGEATDADLPEVSARPTVDRRPAARVARPASIAQVARVARPARVAVPGSATGTVGRSAPAPAPTTAGGSAPTPVDVPVPAPPASALEAGTLASEASSPASANPEAAPRVAEAEPRVRDKRRSDTARPSEMATGQERPTARPVSTAFPPVREVGTADPMAQVDRILEVREAMASVNNAQRVTVRLDGTAGPVEKVHVELMDQALRGSVDVNDPALAARLRGEVGEVLRTLEEKGYDPQSLAVKLTNASSETAREGLGGALRNESTIQALRTVLGTQAGTSGRDAHDRSQSGARQGQDSQNAFEQQSRRENRRDRR